MPETKIDTISKLTAAELARLLSMSVNGLYGWRARGVGPISHKFDRDVFFYLNDVLSFLKTSYVNLQNLNQFMGFDLLSIPLIDEEEASNNLDIPTSVIHHWRRRGVGPSYFKMGKLVRYRKADILEYRVVLAIGAGPKRINRQAKPKAESITHDSRRSSFRQSWLGRLLFRRLF